MKKLILSLLLVSFGAQASFNDFECRFNSNTGSDVFLEIERSFNSPTKRIELTVNSDEGVKNFQYFANARFDRNFRRINFFGGGINLEIDIWPHTRPQYGRRYRASLRTPDLDNGMTTDTFCVFTGF